jgi:hypothetical protein
MFPPRLMVMLAATIFVVGCDKSEDNCPGQCADESVLPSMTIVTVDGAASIASANVLSGPCTKLLSHSEGEVGVPTGYAAVQVIYDPTSATLAQSGGTPPMCIIELKSLWGDVEAVSTQVTAKPYQKACCPYGTCCPKTQDALTQRYHLDFDQPTQIVSFLPGPDGGAPDAADAAQTPVDAETIDSSAIDTAGVDGLVADAEAFDGPGVDTAAIDLAELDVAAGS